MTTIELTLHLPEPVVRRLEEAAAETHRPLAEVAAQSIAGNLPPSAARLPERVREELAAMASQSDADLLALAHAQAAAADQERHAQLLERASNGVLTADEQRELAALRDAADALMLRKAHAWSILRWRGHPVPSLGELSADEG